MVILKDVVLLAAASARSQAYVQAMIKANLMPEKCILFVGNTELLEVGGGKNNAYVNLSESLVDSLELYETPYEIIEEENINSDKIANVLRNLPQSYVVYSGYGGYILKPHLFQLGKKYIHVHAGLLPQYRGSTTAYYSILQDNCIGATSIFLNEKIDEGDILYQGTYPLPSSTIDIDYVYEPWVRSQVLIKTLKQYAENGFFLNEKQKSDGAETYYIIHPVLKHLALWKVEQLNYA